jgi:hypothetical protein
MTAESGAHEKQHILLLEFGRDKEAYFSYFFHEKGKDLNGFVSDIKVCVKEAAEELIQQHKAKTGKVKANVDNFDLLFGAEKYFADHGYKVFEPLFILFRDEEFDLQIKSSFEPNAEGNEQKSAKSDMGIFELINWDGIYQDNLKRRFFNCNNSSQKAYSLIKPEYNKIVKKISAYKSKNPDYGTREVCSREINKLKGNYMDNLAALLSKNGFQEISFHSSFWGCGHSLADYMEEIIGTVNYAKLLKINNSKAKPKGSESAINPDIVGSAGEDEPF